MKTGANPTKVRLKLFFNWGITFDEDNPYTVDEMVNRQVRYATKQKLLDEIICKYAPEYVVHSTKTDEGMLGGHGQTESQSNEPQTSPPPKTIDKRKGTRVKTTPPPGYKPPSMDEVKPNEST